jgi:hypothetical protein
MKEYRFGKLFTSSWDTASVDRIDSSKGYTKDNIQFVCFMANIAKNKFSCDELINFCNLVSEFNKKE